MSPSTMTAVFIVGTILVIAGYDLFVLLTFGVDSTISRVLSRVGRRWRPFAYLSAFALGMLFGHFFL